MSAPREWTLEQTNAISRVGLIVADQREKSNLTARLDADACQVVLDALLTLRHERDEARKERDEVRAENAVLMERNRLLQSCVDDNSQAIIAVREQRVEVEQERDLLAAECRAWRAWHAEYTQTPAWDGDPNDEPLSPELVLAWNHANAARAAVDAAGVLGREER